jgi:hypothetical protein
MTTPAYFFAASLMRQKNLAELTSVEFCAKKEKKIERNSANFGRTI